MELIEVKTCDVYPDGSNPRTDFGDLDALADTFDLNRTRPGEPIEPPQLVRDGGIYLIADGERRYRAMRSRGKESFMAIVYDDWDEADSVMAMLLTDHKERLGDLGTSRGVQRALRLGVDPVRIERATGLEGVQRARRAIAKVGDAAEDMTFDRLLAIEEFSDDPEAVSRISKANEGRWKDLVEHYRRRRAEHERMAAFLEIVKGHGLEVVESVDRTAWTYYIERDDGGIKYTGGFRKPEELESFLDEADPQWGLPIAVVDMKPGVDLYFPRREENAAAGGQEEEIDPELAKRSAALLAACEAEEARQQRWAAELFRSGEISRRTALGPNLRATFLDDVVLFGFEGWPELESCALSAVDYALAWERSAPDSLNEYWCDVVVGATKCPERNKSYPLELLDWLDAIEAAGYQKNDDSRLMRAELEAWRDRDAEGGEVDG